MLTILILLSMYTRTEELREWTAGSESRFLPVGEGIYR